VMTYDGLPVAGVEIPRAPIAPAPKPMNGAVATTSSSVRAAPSVRHLARKLGVDLGRIHGSGPGGRVLIDDLAAAAPTAPREGAKPQAALELGVAGTRTKMVGLRRAIAQRMTRSKNAIPHYTYIDEIDVTDLVRLRQQVTDHFTAGGVKLSFVAFFVRAAVRALKEVPIVNSTFDEETDEIVTHDKYHVGIAVATPGGLMVPVIRDADRMDLAQVARAIERLSADARTGKAKRDDLTGGTFTITSIGGIGGLISTPIINHPEVAILGIGKVVKRPVYDATGNVRPADMVYVSISFDHRVVDGAVGATFGNALARQLAKPAALLLPDN